MDAATEYALEIGISTACAAFNVPRASWYRGQKPVLYGPKPPRNVPRALSKQERQAVLDTVNSSEFQDKAPSEVVATLLDRSQYLCSERTIYRILAANSQVRERRDQLRHPTYTKPELLAERPNQVWSWDITKLKGPVKWSYFHLYVIIDIFSRYVVGWMVAHRESAELAQLLIAKTLKKQTIGRDELTIHADRGTSMTSLRVAHLLANLGVTKTHSRPHVSDDNPYSESHFKTMKYQPQFPDKFGCLQDARGHCRRFMKWYNDDHHHSGIEMLTPAQLHDGRGAAVLAARGLVMQAAYTLNSNRFVHGSPAARKVPVAAWINPPQVAVVAPLVH